MKTHHPTSFPEKETRPRRVFRDLGFTLLEVMVAASILAFALAGLYAMAGNALVQQKGMNQAMILQEALVYRQDQLRDLGWPSLCDPTRISSLLSELPGITDSSAITTETISVYLITPSIGTVVSTPDTSPYYIITKTSVAQGAGYNAAKPLADQAALAFRVREESTTDRGAIVVNESSIIISHTGTNK